MDVGTSANYLQSGRTISTTLGVLVLVGALVSTSIGALTLFASTRFLALVGQPEAAMGPAAAVFADYAGAREVAIGVALLAVLATRSARCASGVLIVAALSNALDAWVAVTAQSWPQLVGALVFALVYALYAWLVRSQAGANG